MIGESNSGGWIFWWNRFFWGDWERRRGSEEGRKIRFTGNRWFV